MERRARPGYPSFMNGLFLLLAVSAHAVSADPSGWIPPNESVSWVGPADVGVRFRLVNRGLKAEEPPTLWDGAHLALRYQGECRAYYVSLNRRDNLAVIKKKAPDGTANCGAYTNLGEYAVLPVRYDTAQDFQAVIRDEDDGSVSINVYLDGRLIVSGKDTGVGGPAIHEPGEIVLRSDNAELEYSNFTLEPVSRPVAKRNGEAERRAPRAALRPDAPAPRLHDPLRDRKP